MENLRDLKIFSKLVRFSFSFKIHLPLFKPKHLDQETTKFLFPLSQNQNSTQLLGRKKERWVWISNPRAPSSFLKSPFTMQRTKMFILLENRKCLELWSNRRKNPFLDPDTTNLRSICILKSIQDAWSGLPKECWGRVLKQLREWDPTT